MSERTSGSRTLGSVLFDEVADDLRSSTFVGSPWLQLAARATPTELPAGRWLFRRDDAGDSMYVVLSGRLEVVTEEPEAAVIRVLGRGDAVGELALLTGSPRSASVKARRDTSLLQVTREAFDELLAEQPDFAVSLTRILGRQLQESRGLSIAPNPLPSTISLVPLSAGIHAEGFADRLSEGLRRFERIDELKEADSETAGSEAAFGRLLDKSERKHDQVLIVSGPPDDGRAWTRFAIRTADRIVALTDGKGEPPSHPRLLGCDLVLLVEGSPPAEAARWIEALDARAVHIVRPGGGDRSAIDRLARGLTGRSVGLVLSGGGARGLAHIGVLEELQDAGVEIDRVAGCSMGAYVAANMALGVSPAELLIRCREEFVERNPMNDYTVPVAAILRSNKARAMLQRTFGSTRIEELPLEFFCVSCDLFNSELVVHRRGSLWQAVGASMSLPAIFPPAAVDGRLLVDGGVLNNLPVEEMAARGDGPVIAVDVTARLEAPQPAASGGKATARAIDRARSLVTGLEDPVPNLKETLIRSIVLGSIDTDAAAQHHADLVIMPETGGIPLTAWKQLEQLRAAGREAARRALVSAPSPLFG